MGLRPVVMRGVVTRRWLLGSVVMVMMMVVMVMVVVGRRAEAVDQMKPLQASGPGRRVLAAQQAPKISGVRVEGDVVSLELGSFIV